MYFFSSWTTCTPSKDGITLLEAVAKPGYWRPDPMSAIFSSCRKGFSGIDVQSQAERRCCPNSMCTNRTMVHPSEQCAVGHTGALCQVYVPLLSYPCCYCFETDVGTATVFFQLGTDQTSKIQPLNTCSVCNDPRTNRREHFIFFILDCTPCLSRCFYPDACRITCWVGRAATNNACFAKAGLPCGAWWSRWSLGCAFLCFWSPCVCTFAWTTPPTTLGNTNNSSAR